MKYSIPFAGTAYANRCSACPADTLILNDSGVAATSGVIYQWQYSSDSITWIDIAGAATIPYSFTPSGNYYYRCAVVCTVSSDTSYSIGVRVYFESSCPCFPQYTRGNPSKYYGMYRFSLTGDSGTYINDIRDSTDTLGYLDRTCEYNIVLHKGGNYSGEVYAAFLDDINSINQIWIDFNDDGIFNSSEAVTHVFTPSGYEIDTVSFILHVPDSVNIGIHRMRIRNVMADFSEFYLYSSHVNPCADTDYYYYDTAYYSEYYAFGECYDYLVNIDTAITTNLPVVYNSQKIQIYPNPIKDNLIINTALSNCISEALIYDITGRELLRQEINSEKTIVNVEWLSPGVYFIYVKSNLGITAMKFVKT